MLRVAPVPTPFPASPVFYLRKNGKALTCRCGERLHYELLARPRFIGEAGVDLSMVYECANPACKNRVPGEPSIDAQLPPRNDWQTPGGTARAPVEGGLWTTLHREYRFNLDAAADAKNAKVPLYLDEQYDALTHDWFGPNLVTRARVLQPEATASADSHHAMQILPEDVRAFVNPPYQPKGSVETWLKRGLAQVSLGVFSVFLVPMSSSVEWFNDLIVPYAEWHTFRGRIVFDDPLASDADKKRTSPKQDNLLVIYNPHSDVIGHTAVRSAKTGEYLWKK